MREWLWGRSGKVHVDKHPTCPKYFRHHGKPYLMMDFGKPEPMEKNSLGFTEFAQAWLLFYVDEDVRPVSDCKRHET
jgi:hypothetical protein